MSTTRASGCGVARAARRRDRPVPSITSAPDSLAVDQARRQRRYLAQMGLRVVFFVAACFVGGWLRWTMLACAVVIPYVAVLLVNAGRDRVEYAVSAVVPTMPSALPPAPDSANGANGAGQTGRTALHADGEYWTGSTE